MRSLPAVLAGAILFTLAWSLGGLASATVSQAPTRLGIDVIPTGSTPTALGQIDSCASAERGDSFDIDLVIENVTDLLAWEIGISYDPAVLEVEDHDTEMFQAANPGSEVVDLSATTTGPAGRYLLQSLDTADPPSPDSGSGVLARLTLKAKGAGVSPLKIDKPDLNGDGQPDQGPFLRNADVEPIGDDDGDTFFDGPVSDAEIRVGEPCPGTAAGAEVETVGGDGGIDLALVIAGTAGGAAILVLAGVLAALLLRRRRAGA
ncbi:MAG: hypothetical protein HYY03_05750 [Chloroflexi bacterium]|nr:hypothetical protein [Chloroflexota bacterium]